MFQKQSMRALLAVGLLVGVAGSAQAENAAPMASAEMLSHTCNGCHGPNGNSHGPASPTIAGSNAIYLYESMIGYKSGARPSTIMARIVKGYTDAELKVIADFFAAKKTKRLAAQTADSKLAAKGQAITRDLCDSCHEKDGYSAEDYPVLAGQMMPYLRNNLADYHSGSRDLDKNPNLSAKERRKKKRNLADLREKHGAEGVEAVVHFYGSLK